MPKRKRAAAAKEKDDLPETSRSSSSSAAPTNNTVPSGDCKPNECQCRVDSSVDLHAFLAGVRGNKAYKGEMSSRGPLNSLSVQLALVEDYISHSRSSHDLKAKQVRLREALRRVAVRLDMPFLTTLNTKTTPFRTFGRALWVGCALEDPTHKSSELRAEQEENKTLVDQVLEQVESEYNDVKIPTAKFASLLHAIQVRSPTEREAAEAALNDVGICIHRKLVPEDMCLHLLSKVGEHVGMFKDRRGTPMTETMALGKLGMYFDTNWVEGGLLCAIQKRVFAASGLDGGEGCGKLPSTNNKAILLAYAQGAENWSHQDDNKKFNYQALLMLSEPGHDFNGGDMHVLKGGDGDEWKKTNVKFMNRGDVAIFRSNGVFFHGMDEVLKGDKKEGLTRRVAVGLYHNSEKKKK